uniref:Secreted protein n=1 Tax=Steinernema glaseri TaxID=37863 RepID=A0A1I7Z5E7_9BILA
MRFPLLFALLTYCVTGQKAIYVYYSDNFDSSRNFYYSVAYEASPSEDAVYHLYPASFPDSLKIQDTGDQDQYLTTNNPVTVNAADGDVTEVSYSTGVTMYFDIKKTIRRSGGTIHSSLGTTCSTSASSMADGNCYLFICDASRFCYCPTVTIDPSVCPDFDYATNTATVTSVKPIGSNTTTIVPPTSAKSSTPVGPAKATTGASISSSSTIRPFTRTRSSTPIGGPTSVVTNTTTTTSRSTVTSSRWVVTIDTHNA